MGLEQARVKGNPYRRMLLGEELRIYDLGTMIGHQGDSLEIG